MFMNRGGTPQMVTIWYLDGNPPIKQPSVYPGLTLLQGIMASGLQLYFDPTQQRHFQLKKRMQPAQGLAHVSGTIGGMSALDLAPCWLVHVCQIPNLASQATIVINSGCDAIISTKLQLSSCTGAQNDQLPCDWSWEHYIWNLFTDDFMQEDL